MKCPYCGHEPKLDSNEYVMMEKMMKAAKEGDNDLAQAFAMDLKNYREHYKPEH